MRDTMAPWRDTGGNRLFSTHVFGTPFMLNEEGQPLPWIATAITSNEEMTVCTMKLREDAVFQDGTPITATDFKAYWEHGAKPENIVAWGGASNTLFNIKGWDELRAGDVTQAEGLRVIDDQTLEIEMYRPRPAWHLYMAAWHVGISKLDQVKSDERWGNAPIGAGPFSLTYDPDSGLTELTRVDVVDKHWNGPHDTPIIEKLMMPIIPDEQSRMVMFENGELHLMKIDGEIYEAALEPGHPLNPLLYVSPYGGLWYISIDDDFAPMEDLLIRKALVRSQDMVKIVGAVWGPTATHAKGVMSSLLPCHNSGADYQPYDPDLARQMLSESSYRDVDNLPPLLIDLHRPDMVEVGVAAKGYWKDNLGVELDILKRGSNVPRREGAQFRRTSRGTWIPDPSQIARAVLPPYRPYPGAPPNGPPRTHLLLRDAEALPLDHPERCAAYQGYEEELIRKAYMVPIREVDPIRWVVQPWLVGFESTFNQDFNTLTTAYVAAH